jgi:hypothetical protein
MNIKSTALLLSLGLLAGCGNDSNSTANQGSSSTNASSGGSPITAPVDYLQAAGRAQQKAVKAVDIASLNQAVQMFNVQEGRNPTNLDELVASKLINNIPDVPYGSKLIYDPASGKVDVVKQ